MLSVLTLALVGVPALSGPPLTTDDPNVVGKGRTELIAATAGLQRSSSSRAWAAPILCLTYGRTSRMDIGLQAAFLSDSDNDNSLTLVAGAKWAPVQRDRVVLAVAPSFGVDTKAPGNEFAFLPLQLEVGIGDWRVGTEGGYEVLRSDGDTWRIGAYTARQVTPKARMLAELYVQSLDPGRDTAVTVGAEVSLPHRLVLLISIGGGVASEQVKRLEWTGYLGLQKRF